MYAHILYRVWQGAVMLLQLRVGRYFVPGRANKGSMTYYTHGCRTPLVRKSLLQPKGCPFFPPHAHMHAPHARTYTRARAHNARQESGARRTEEKDVQIYARGTGDAGGGGRGEGHNARRTTVRGQRRPGGGERGEGPCRAGGKWEKLSILMTRRAEEKG